MISQKALASFKHIWKEEYGEEISDDFALENATNLLSFFDVVYRPVKQSWLLNLKNVFRKILYNRYTRSWIRRLYDGQ